MLGYYKLRKKIKEKFLGIKIQENNFNFTKKQESLYLFGNGYTLKDFDLNTLKNQDCFICNAFFRMPNFIQFVELNNVIDFSLDSFSQLSKTAQKTNKDLEILLDEYVNPKIGLNFPLVKTSDFIPYILDRNPNQSIITNTAFLGKFKHLVNKKVIFEIANKIGHTPQYMLLIGILMGYKKIYLYGLEHNYVKDILNKSELCGTHFYNDTLLEVLNNNGEFSREQAKIVLSELLDANANIFRGYERISVLAKQLDTEIIDKSNGSLFMFQDFSLFDLI